MNRLSVQKAPIRWRVEKDNTEKGRQMEIELTENGKRLLQEMNEKRSFRIYLKGFG